MRKNAVSYCGERLREVGTDSYMTSVHDNFLETIQPTLTCLGSVITLVLLQIISLICMTMERLQTVFISEIHSNNIVGGKLLALPLYSDFGLFFYRKDLCEKYQLSCPPSSYDEMEVMAKIILDGERAEGNDELEGFVFRKRV